MSILGWSNETGAFSPRLNITMHPSFSFRHCVLKNFSRDHFQGVSGYELSCFVSRAVLFFFLIFFRRKQRMQMIRSARLGDNRFIVGCNVSSPPQQAPIQWISYWILMNNDSRSSGI